MHAQVMDRAEWDEEQEAWVVQRLPKQHKRRPISSAHHRRPVTAYAQAAVALGDHNPRYKTDNILALALDMPDRTTADYSGSHVQTQVGHSPYIPALKEDVFVNCVGTKEEDEFYMCRGAEKGML